MKEDELPEFAPGTVVCIYLSNKPPKQGHYVADPKLETRGGRLFLTGTIPDQSSMKGMPIGIAWDRVDGYILGDSLDDFRDKQPEEKAGNDGEKTNFKLADHMPGD